MRARLKTPDEPDGCTGVVALPQATGSGRLILQERTYGPDVTLNARIAWQPCGERQADFYLAYSAGSDVVSFLKDVGINIPPQYTSAPYVHSAPPDAGLNVWRLFTEGWSSTGAVLNVPAMIIVALITIMLIIGISESAGFNDVIYEPAFALNAKRDGYVPKANDTVMSHMRNPMPVGISFWAGVGEEPAVIHVASVYEAATHHRRPPAERPGTRHPFG